MCAICGWELETARTRLLGYRSAIHSESHSFVTSSAGRPAPGNRPHRDRLRFAPNLHLAQIGELEFVTAAAQRFVGPSADQDVVVGIRLVQRLDA
jgi:hypothetical protein